MGYSEYLASRDFLVHIGQPLMVYILIAAMVQGIFSVLYLAKNKDGYYDYLLKFLYISTGLYVLGFIFLVWFHLQIYNTVLIEYPPILRGMIPVESSRFAIPLWIEAEKLYFWTMGAFIFTVIMQRRKDLVSFTCIILSIFSVILYFFSNPFNEPLPVVHSEITTWYSALAGNGNIFQTAGMLYGRIEFYYNSAYMWMHPPMLLIAYASLIVTFAACAYMLKKREKAYDGIAYRYAKIGYLLLTLGMLLGYPWAIQAWKGSAWWWDPKISGSIMMWALYSAYLHAHVYVNRGKMFRVSAYLGIICFASLIFTYLLTYTVPGIHSMVQP